MSARPLVENRSIPSALLASPRRIVLTTLVLPYGNLSLACCSDPQTIGDVRQAFWLDEDKNEIFDDGSGGQVFAAKCLICRSRHLIAEIDAPDTEGLFDATRGGKPYLAIYVPDLLKRIRKAQQA